MRSKDIRSIQFYAGTRGAIVAFNRELAIELAPRGIRVNAIAPGSVEVENQHKVIFDLILLNQAGTFRWIHRPACGHRQCGDIPCFSGCQVYRRADLDCGRRHHIVDAVRGRIP